MVFTNLNWKKFFFEGFFEIFHLRLVLEHDLVGLLAVLGLQVAILQTLKNKF